ncbi:MAG: Asp23/Gls24 family envelope stress response protein [Firmicutes bacterium]|nr:Asp23/Gls24 family envelope stress response protein [Bacillota bacterium]
MEVLALIGSSGTGKSYRASLVAHDLGVDLIIDDGLLIKDSKILAGRSAKREATMLGAVRRAIFSDPADAIEVSTRIRELNPKRLLILGTSREMVDKIVEALNLPLPCRIIDINEVSSQEDVRRAIRIRREQGKHVIPAPTFEVKKTFSGYLVDPLRFFLRRRAEPGDHPFVIEKSVVRPTFSSLGKFMIADSVVMAIATRAAREAPGVARVIKVQIESSDEGVVLTVDLSVSYGHQVYRVMEDVQRAVRKTVEHMTALNVLAVNARARKLSTD